MEHINKNRIKISIKYNDDTDSWNKLVNEIISFLMENDSFTTMLNKEESENE